MESRFNLYSLIWSYPQMRYKGIVKWFENIFKYIKDISNDTIYTTFNWI